MLKNNKLLFNNFYKTVKELLLIVFTTKKERKYAGRIVCIFNKIKNIVFLPFLLHVKIINV